MIDRYSCYRLKGLITKAKSLFFSIKPNDMTYH